jgi:hypothetical protein
MLSVLAPDHTGLTLQEQPVVFWYLSQSVSTPIEFTVIDDGIKPVIETTLQPPFRPGVQRISLADVGLRLTTGKAYQWFVAVVVDPERRSKDLLAGGTIERVEAPDALGSQLSHVDQLDTPRLYAEAGLWYDAIAAISDLIEAAPHDPGFRQQRAALLEQAGLPEIVKYDLVYRAQE